MTLAIACLVICPLTLLIIAAIGTVFYLHKRGIIKLNFLDKYLPMKKTFLV